MDAHAYERLARLEQQVDWLFAQAGHAPPNGTIAPDGTTWPYPVSPAVVELIRDGKMVQAIKQVRTETSLGLAAAKDLADSTADMLRRGV